MNKRLVLLVLSAAVMSTAFFADSSTAAQDVPRRIDVTASKFTYAPSEITLKKNQPVVLVLKSTDVRHGLKFSELNINVRIEKGGTTEVKLTPEKTGDFVGHCSVFCGSGHGGMTLTLHVVD